MKNDNRRVHGGREKKKGGAGDSPAEKRVAAGQAAASLRVRFRAPGRESRDRETMRDKLARWEEQQRATMANEAEESELDEAEDEDF